jgi:hypothetical protein
MCFFFTIAVTFLCPYAEEVTGPSDSLPAAAEIQIMTMTVKISCTCFEG